MLAGPRKKSNALFSFCIIGIIVFVLVIEYELNQGPDFIVVDDKLYKHNPLTFSENELWYKEKLSHTEVLPLSEYTTETKKILVWTENWPGSPKYNLILLFFFK